MESEVFAEEIKSERGGVGGIRLFDVDGDGAGEVFVDVLAEIVLSAGGVTLLVLCRGFAVTGVGVVAVICVLRVVGQLADRDVVRDKVLAAVGRSDDRDSSLGGHVDDCWVCCD